MYTQINEITLSVSLWNLARCKASTDSGLFSSLSLLVSCTSHEINLVMAQLLLCTSQSPVTHSGVIVCHGPGAVKRYPVLPGSTLPGLILFSGARVRKIGPLRFTTRGLGPFAHLCCPVFSPSLCLLNNFLLPTSEKSSRVQHPMLYAAPENQGPVVRHSRQRVCNGTV